MKRTALIGLTLAAMVGVAGCENMTPTEQRALSGGALGAAGGAAIGAIAGAPATGAAIGGVGGAAIGALTSPGYYDRYGYYHRY